MMSNELPVYPDADLNRGSQLLVQLGSFWFNIFEDRENLRTHMRSNAHEQMQTYLGFTEAVAAVSRFTVPVFHVENWHLITALESETLAVPSVYGPDDLVYGPQPGNGRPAGFVQTYGGADRTNVVQVKLSGNLVNARFTLQNAVTAPTKTWINGIDYDVDTVRGLLRFRSNPFEDAAVPVRDIFDAAGNRVDREFALWVYSGEFDLDYVYTQFGYALGVKLSSAQGYKDLLNALWDMHLLGPSRRDLQLYLAALSGTPTVLNPREVVEVVQVEETSQLIVTDASVYRVPLGATGLPAVGDTIYAGDPLTDAISVSELSGADPDFSILSAMSLSSNFMSGNFISELTFRNSRVGVDYVGIDAEGKAEVRFEVNGFPGDVEEFWTAVHAKGKAEGATLANLLDTRENKVGEPGPSNMPALINPMEFALDNFMRNNLFFIKVKLAGFDSNAPGVAMFKELRDIMPPHVTYISMVELAPDAENVDLSTAGNELEAGVEEELGVFLGAVPVLDEVYEVSAAPAGAASYEDVVVSARAVSLVCQ